MIKIAVCDDNPNELEEVAEKIKIYLDQQETALQTVVQTFQCGISLKRLSASSG